MYIDNSIILIIIIDTAVINNAETTKGASEMLFYNWEKMRYEREGDKRPDLLAEKLEDWGWDYGCDSSDDYSDDEADLY